MLENLAQRASLALAAGRNLKLAMRWFIIKNINEKFIII